MESYRSHHVIELITVANEFCLFTESAEKYSLPDLIKFYQKVAPLLYLKGALIQPVAVESTEANEKFITEENWQKVYDDLKEKFKEKELFFIVDAEGEQVSKMSIAELIADVYQDMKDFITLYQKNTRDAQKCAVGDIFNYFYSNWGDKVIKIQQAVHTILQTER